MAKKPAKRPIGRPSKYDPAYCEVVIELGKLGKSDSQMAAALNVDRASIYRWRDEHSEFRACLSRAQTFAHAVWDGMGFDGATGAYGRDFNALAWKVSVQSRFREDYTERRVQEISGANGGPVQTVVEQRTTIDASKLTPEQRDALRAALMAARKP